jgi:TPR repeat protein
MSGLPQEIHFDEVILRLAKTFGPQSTLEREFREECSEEFDEVPEWKLLEKAVEFGHLHPIEIIDELGRAFSNELSQSSCRILRRIDRTFLQAAALGKTSSLWVISLRLLRESVKFGNEKIEEDLKNDGLFLLMEAAEAGYVRAQWMLGERFSRMNRGLEESVRLLGMAALQNYEPAKERLIELYGSLYTFVHAPSETKWLRRFSQAGVAEAQFDFANNLCLKGEQQAAFAWLLEAAKSGHKKAQMRLCLCYETGTGCTKDLEQSKYWSRRSIQVEDLAKPSAELDNAYEDSGEAYEDIDEVPEDSGEACEDIDEVPEDINEADEDLVDEEEDFDEASENVAESTQDSPAQTSALEQTPEQEKADGAIELTPKISDVGLDFDAGADPMKETKTELVSTSEDRPHEHPLETKELIVDVQVPELEHVAEPTEQNECSNFPIPPADTNKGFVSRLRRSFADALKRLAERISGDSKSPKDGK